MRGRIEVGCRRTCRSVSRQFECGVGDVEFTGATAPREVFDRMPIRIARGEIQHKDLAKFPQILVAPAMIAVIWQSLFARHAPLDAIEMLRVHLDLIFGERRPA